ncbi:hypothetical protein I552_1472 [Mycobacterium xenopi 3993]|nr:hypothetical protein I552_1472 [Mycobacterium xenopi 3993]
MSRSGDGDDHLAAARRQRTGRSVQPRPPRLGLGPPPCRRYRQRRLGERIRAGLPEVNLAVTTAAIRSALT